MKTGIEAIDFYIPNLFVSIDALAKYRNIVSEKLQIGLGLRKMTIPDTNEDTASFAANALWKLIDKNEIDPKTIGRVYLGTESALDASKPTATYAIEVVETKLTSKYGERCFKNCDVVDITFACIGAVDAFQNCLDWVRNKPERKAIVIASDISKYALNSTGEYTQGAGAVAILISNNPSIIEIDDIWGVAVKSEGDFFKPKRFFKKKEIIKELVAINKRFSEKKFFDKIIETESGFWSDSNTFFNLHKEEPIFDGHFSNQCYSDRITEALSHFKMQSQVNFLANWNYLVFHLPYAFHGRRIIFENWIDWLKQNNKYSFLENEIGVDYEDNKSWKRAAVKSNLYKEFLANKVAAGELASSEIGNMYTASIFMGLLSLLCNAFDCNLDISEKKIGFIAYGSGSKSKIFQGKVCKNWKNSIRHVELFKTLRNRQEVSIETYLKLHTGIQEQPITNAQKSIVLKSISSEKNKQGLRYYSF